MSKELIVSVNGREKKIAIVEDDLVTEFYVERGDENQGIVGNIYKGRVMKVLPGMQSAFVDIGLERDSFLYVSDFFDEDEEEGEEKKDVRPARPEARADARTERPTERPTDRGSERQADRSAERQTDRNTERLDKPDRARGGGRGPTRPVPVIAVEEEEEEDDLQLTALEHIEEISSEPVLEPAPDDEPIEDSGKVDRLTSRQRRQRRLQYTEPADEETVAEAVVTAAEEEEADQPVAEAEEDPSEGRRSRNRRPARRGRGRGGEDRTSEKAAEPVAATIAEESPAPYILVHHEPFERITDDDLEETEGDLLREAMMQQRVANALQLEDRHVEILDFEPTPEVQVGSLQTLASGSDFERISDAEEAEDAAPATPTDVEASTVNEGSADEPQASADESQTGDAPTETESEAAPQYRVEEVDEDVQVVHLDSSAGKDAADKDGASPQTAGATKESQAEGDPIEGQAATESQPEAGESAPTQEEAGESSEAPEASEPLPEVSARVRGRAKRGEMATRRGGRGRGRTYRRSATTDATADAEFQDEEDDEAGDEASPAPSASVGSRAPERSNDRNGGRTSSRPPERAHDRYSRPAITDLLREGQEVIVQIAKEPIGQKGARITSHVALPGRYIVYMPTVEHIGVSRKIGTDEDRLRLKRALQQFRAEAGAPGGFIVRTAAINCTLEELREDMQYLIRTWTDIRRRADRAKAPAIAHRDLDLVQRILRDQLSSDFSAIRVDNEFEYERIVDFVNRFAPKLVHRVKLYTKDTPILEAYGVQAEIDKAVKPRVWLKSGGYIVINQTEALVAIDVNTGKFVGKSNRLEDTIVKTNLEAAKEIVRQIRLRDLGGIIVLDFIDMEERRNRAKVMAALEQELRSDRSPSKILQFNDFGLVAITRKRVKQSLERTLCTPCSYCGGGGMVKSAQTICYEILAESRRISKEIDPANEVILRVNPEVAKALRQSERDVLNEIESYLGGVVTIKSDPTVHQEQFDIAIA